MGIRVAELHPAWGVLTDEEAARARSQGAVRDRDWLLLERLAPEEHRDQVAALRRLLRGGADELIPAKRRGDWIAYRGALERQGVAAFGAAAHRFRNEILAWESEERVLRALPAHPGAKPSSRARRALRPMERRRADELAALGISAFASPPGRGARARVALNHAHDGLMFHFGEALKASGAGWERRGSRLASDVLQWFAGRDVKPGTIRQGWDRRSDDGGSS